MALTVMLSACFRPVLHHRRRQTIKFIPYQVVSGYLSGVALLIAIGQLPKLLGLPTGIDLSQGLFSPGLWRWQGLVVGIVTMTVMGLAPLVTARIPAVTLGLLAGRLPILPWCRFLRNCSN